VRNRSVIDVTPNRFVTSNNDHSLRDALVDQRLRRDVLRSLLRIIKMCEDVPMRETDAAERPDVTLVETGSVRRSRRPRGLRIRESSLCDGNDGCPSPFIETAPKMARGASWQELVP
jgi:hypothetical protein